MGCRSFFRKTGVGSQGRTTQPLRTRASGRDDRRQPSRRAIINLYAADVSTAFVWRRRVFLSNLGDKFLMRNGNLSGRETPAGQAIRPLRLTCYNQRFPMADILPFRALRYNLEKVTAAEVVTQPYDKITLAMQDHYYAASPFNLVRIILGRREPSDNTTDNVYTRAAAFGREWREKTIFRQDSSPSIYTYSQTFTAPSGKKFERRGFIALAGWRITRRRSFSVTSRRSPSQRPTGWTCCAQPARTTSSCSCCTKIQGRLIPCLRARSVPSSRWRTNTEWLIECGR